MEQAPPGGLWRAGRRPPAADRRRPSASSLLPPLSTPLPHLRMTGPPSVKEALLVADGRPIQQQRCSAAEVVARCGGGRMRLLTLDPASLRLGARQAGLSPEDSAAVQVSPLLAYAAALGPPGVDGCEERCEVRRGRLLPPAGCCTFCCPT